MTDAGWTATKPTEAGWYWWRFREGKDPVVMKIGDDHIAKTNVFTIGTSVLLIDELPGEWLGPISPSTYHQGRAPAWQGKDAQITSLQTALDAEREKVKGLHEATKVICGHCCEPMEIPSKAVLQSQLSALQGLVRALPVVNGEIRSIGQNVVNGEHNYLSRLDSGLEAGAYTALLQYRATLPATPQERGQGCVQHVGEE